MRYNPHIDVIFKRLFGTPENVSILLDFINAVLAGTYQLKTLELLNPYQPGMYVDDKLSILDIKARDDQGQYYNIEMQVTDQVYYNQRALYYWSKLYTEQLKKGGEYALLNKTISIHVLNFNYFDQEVDYHNVFHILNAKSRKRAFEDFEMHFIELRKLQPSTYKTQMLSALDRWVTFLSARYDKNDIPPALTENPEIVKAIGALETMHLDKREKEIYEGQEKWIRDEAAAIQTAQIKGMKKGLEKGLEKGMREGLEKGLEKGEQIGLEKGEQIGLEKGKQQIAKNLLQTGQSVEAVAKLTGLPLATVEKLR